MAAFLPISTFLPRLRMPFQSCPICQTRISSLFIINHAASCSGGRPRKKISRSIVKKSSDPKVPSPTTRKRLSIEPTNLSSDNTDIGYFVFPNVFNDNDDHNLHEKILSLSHSTPPSWSDYRFRQSKNYGPPYDLYNRRFLFHDSSKFTQLPDYAREMVIPVLKSLLPLLNNFNPNQLSVNMYQAPGQTHILPHNDCENARIGTAVVGVCLGSTCTMTLMLKAKFSQSGKTVKRNVLLRPGTVYVMSGDSLHIWDHAIFPGKTEGVRTSLTFRDVSPHV